MRMRFPVSRSSSALSAARWASLSSRAAVTSARANPRRSSTTSSKLLNDLRQRAHAAVVHQHEQEVPDHGRQAQDSGDAPHHGLLAAVGNGRRDERLPQFQGSLEGGFKSAQLRHGFLRAQARSRAGDHIRESFGVSLGYG